MGEPHALPVAVVGLVREPGEVPKALLGGAVDLHAALLPTRQNAEPLRVAENPGG